MSRLPRVVLLAAVFLGGCDLFNTESSNASLSALTISGATLDPDFASAVFGYSATVDAGTTSVSVSARPSQHDAAVAINGQRADGGSSVNVALAAGTNQIAVVVLSEDRTERNVYTVSVTRAAPTYSVGGSVNGLLGSLSLQNNGADDLTLSTDGPFAFASELDDGADYDVTVSNQPAGQTCTVNNGAGTVSGADVTDVSVDCVSEGTWRVGGVVSGLIGTAVLQLNGDNNLLIAKNGVFAFGPAFADGASYAITVLQQPAGQTCAISNGSGTFAGAHAIDVSVECTGAGTATSSVFDWQWVNPLPQGDPIYAFATDGTQLVAVGYYGLVQTTTDGLSWTRRDPGTGDLLVGIVWDGSRFVAVGNGGSVLASPDGVSWQTLAILRFVGVSSFTWNGSVYVAVGGDSATGAGAIATSADGVNWSIQALGQSGAAYIPDVTWNGSVFAAVQQPTDVLTSADGTNWTRSQLDSTGAVYLQTIASDGSRFVAADGSGILFTSVDDGATWTRETNPLPITGVTDIRWDGSRFVAAGYQQYATSADGSTWTAHVVDASTNLGLTGMTRFNSLNIAAGSNGAVYTSPDDSSWTTPFSDTFGGIWDVIWHGNQFIAVGAESTIRTSPDGLTWTTQLTNAGALATTAITQGGGQYVAVGSGSQDQVLTSPDAVTWTGHTVSMSNLSPYGVAWGNSQYVAVGNGGLILTSPDGATWTQQTAGIDGDELMYDVAWNGSVWVVAGYQISGGTLVSFLATSPDGIDWTKQIFPNWLIFQGLEWNGSMMVAAGSGAIATSTDGLNWSLLQTQVAASAITWSGSAFVLTGGPEVLMSTDGMSWSVSRAPSGFHNAIASDGTTTVLVSPNGHLLTKP
jgi:hypothetical protein